MAKGAVTVLVLAWLAAAASAAEREAIDPALLERFEARVFRDASGRSLRYRLFKPAQHDARDARASYPLVLFLHGAAGLGEDNQRQFNGGNSVPPRVLTSEQNQAKHPCFVLAPQCPRSDSWSADPGQKHPPEVIRLTFETMEALQREFPIDSQRLYLIGISMGGRGLWDVVTRFPKTFAAAVPICAAGDPSSAPRIKSLPIWCFHGEADPLVSVDYARRMMAALRRAGGNPRYTEYAGVGHDSYKNAFDEPELLPWLFAQRRPAGK